MLAENAAEMAFILIAKFKGNLFNGKVASEQQLFCFRGHQAVVKFVRTYAIARTLEELDES